MKGKLTDIIYRMIHKVDEYKYRNRCQKYNAHRNRFKSGHHHLRVAIAGKLFIITSILTM